MNNPFPYNGNMLPQSGYTDWASMARQWANLRGSNYPNNLQEANANMYANIPPPPPPPVTPLMNIDTFPYYQNYPTDSSNQAVEEFNDGNCDYLSNSYETNNSFKPENASECVAQNPPSYIDKFDQTSKSYNEKFDKNNYNYGPNYNENRCESFDYNHNGDQYNDQYLYTSNANVSHESNHQSTGYKNEQMSRSLNTNDYSPSRVYLESHYDQSNPITRPPTLFPITDVFDYSTVPVTSNQSYQLGYYGANTVNAHKPDMLPKTSKGLPAWIIDDMKKMKEKERKHTVNNVNFIKDNHVNTKRDEEGDVVMEEDSRDYDVETSYTGKAVPKQLAATEADIDDVSLHDDDDVIDKVDYASKTLEELVDMLEDNELEEIKLLIIRSSLTSVMKEVSDNMISDVVKQCFSAELSSIFQDNLAKDCIGATVKPIYSPKESQTTVVGTLLGLDAYESDDDNAGNQEEEKPSKPEHEELKPPKVNREKWCTHKKADEKKQHKSSSSGTRTDKSPPGSTVGTTCDDDSIVITSGPTNNRSERRRSRDRQKRRSRSSDRSHKRRSRSKERSHKSHKKSDKRRDNQTKDESKQHSSSKYSSHKKSKSSRRSRS